MDDPTSDKGRPFPTVGILGGGQLGRMLCAAAMRLGIRTRTYQTQDSGPAGGTADVFTGAWDDTEQLGHFLRGCDVLTLDNEWVDLVAVARHPMAPSTIWPSPHTMSLVSDKTRQRDHAQRCGLPVGAWMVCSSEADLDQAAETLGFPMVLKRPRHSYDGYGNRTVDDHESLRKGYRALAHAGSVLAEQWVPFERELAVIVARRPGGESLAYPVAATVQRDHKCHAVEVPAPIDADLAAAARALAMRAAEAYEVVGVVGVELFALADGTLLLNEIAPRPHNTGHFTIDACVTSQFENHLRAILDLPLGDPSMLRSAAAMVNVVGHRQGVSSAASLGAALAVRGAAVHLYGKHEVRAGRKMGHVTAVADSLAEARATADEAARKLEL